VVAITGSNGKTTTREMTTCVLAQQFHVLSPYGNYNNEIGLPLTLLHLNDSHEWAVLELGMNHPGEIAYLTKICAPDIGIITNIGPAHLEGLDSIDAVTLAKGELLEHMAQDATAVLNADDPRLMRIAGNATQRVILYGTSHRADLRLLSLATSGLETSFMMALRGERLSVNLNIPGDFMVPNALAAAAVGDLAGLSPERIKRGLEAFRPVSGRMNILDTAKGIHIIDDTYNANPASMEAAIRTLNRLRGSGRAILVLGDMLELGRHADSMHQKIGALAAEIQATKLYATGDFSESISEGAIRSSMDIEDIFVGEKEDIFEDLKQKLVPGDWVLVKGSRSMGMEKIVRQLRDWSDQ
jgi:UDP-N-acetylmuramoyl-tripeptide--D-alanyl-D-alanine ligase